MDASQASTRENQEVSPNDMIAMGDAVFDDDPLGGHSYLEYVFHLTSFYNLYNLNVRCVPPGESCER